jgi:hypothetical protein
VLLDLEELLLDEELLLFDELPELELEFVTTVFVTGFVPF